MRPLRFGLVLLLLATSLLPVLRGAEEISRIDQLREQIKDRETLLAQSTKNNEKAQFQKQLDRLRRELEIAEQRARLEEKSRNLTRARPVTPQSALKAAVDVVEHSPEHLETELQRVEAELVKMELQRDALVTQRAQLKGADEKSLALAAELDERIIATREGVQALRFEREALAAEHQLVEEARRADEALNAAQAMTEVKLGTVLDTRDAIVAAHARATEAGADLTELQEKRIPVLAGLELDREKLAQLDDEISFLEKQTGILNSNVEIVRQLRVARSQRKFLDLKLTYIEGQLATLDRAILATSRSADLHAKQGAWLEGVYLDRRARYARQLLTPAVIVAVFALFYLMLSRVVFPRMKHRENLVLMRRFARYLTLVAAVAVMGGFLFEDLKMLVATLGIVSAAIVIALQDVAASIAGWVVIMTGGKFRIGDRIEVDGDRGDVIDIDLLRTTILEVTKRLGAESEVSKGFDSAHPTGRVIALPNSFVLKGKVFNASHGHPFVWSRQVFTFTNESPWRVAEELVHRVLEEETAADFAEARKAAAQMEKRYGVSDAEYTPKVYVRLADWGTEFACLHVCHFRKVDEVRSRIHRRMAEELSKDPRLVVAYPTQRQVTGFENVPPAASHVTSGPAVTAVASMPVGSAATVTVSDMSATRSGGA